ncbi:PilN domain-containing protein [Nitrosomonas oligotropha]|uniref:PilN domain-containing protein n=1 Tax=Nitrosomonas oligotropha TaxID=42354 RepID=UPI00136F4CD3|nr:PilN domain-containing protein [Nitrosomonas oligotropha]MXS82201.1 fimbrial assembly protein [Nitrosomonas oligotropha]
MPRLRLKFPDRGQSVPHIDFSILLIGLLVLAGVLLQFRQVTEEVNHWTNRVERLEKHQQQKAAPRTRSTPRIKEFSQEIRKEITQANAILDQINLPWETLFDAIEHAATDEIALLSLQPNVASRTLRLSGEAKSMSELLDFVEALERELVFENVHLLNYKVKQDNPHRPIIFLLTAVWMQVS